MPFVCVNIAWLRKRHISGGPAGLFCFMANATLQKWETMGLSAPRYETYMLYMGDHGESAAIDAHSVLSDKDRKNSQDAPPQL